MKSSEIMTQLDEVRRRAPLVHNITNFVTMNNSANATLAVGASPAMIHSSDEVQEFVSVADALVINIGTLESSWRASMRLAAEAAVASGTPWVFDPVGASISRYRRQVALDLLDCKPTVLRGNGSEIASLTDMLGTTTRGVDSRQSSEMSRASAISLAQRNGCVVALTGEVDFVTNGQSTVRIVGGHEMMARVTALGCSLSAVVGAFVACAGRERQLEAAVAALAVFAAAGRAAALNAPGPGTLQLRLLDFLYCCDSSLLDQHVEIIWEQGPS